MSLGPLSPELCEYPSFCLIHPQHFNTQHMFENGWVLVLYLASFISVLFCISFLHVQPDVTWAPLSPVVTSYFQTPPDTSERGHQLENLPKIAWGLQTSISSLQDRVWACSHLAEGPWLLSQFVLGLLPLEMSGGAWDTITWAVS